MNKQKTKFGEALLEVLLEIVMAIVCFVVGALVMHLLGVDFAELDADTLVLVGVVVFIIVLFVVCWVVQAIKKLTQNKRAKGDQDNSNSDDNIQF